MLEWLKQEGSRVGAYSDPCAYRASRSCFLPKTKSLDKQRSCADNKPLIQPVIHANPNAAEGKYPSRKNIQGNLQMGLGHIFLINSKLSAACWCCLHGVVLARTLTSSAKGRKAGGAGRARAAWGCSLH